MSAERRYGMAYLTLAPMPAPQSVRIAAEAGYDFIGLRVSPFNVGDPDLGMGLGSPLLRETARVLRDTGLTALDFEFILLTETIDRSVWMRTLEAGAFLGASIVAVAAADPDLSRVRDNLAMLTQDAREFGVRPALETISYEQLNDFSTAATMASNTGSALLVDPLHLTRRGTTPDALADVDPDLIPVLQLCDAPMSAPGDGGRAALTAESRSGRLPVGEGELPLRAFVTAAPAGVPISVEIPNPDLRSATTDAMWAADNLAAARRLVEGIDGAG
jgi:sugar phosphate isomerase/epimerase